ncbi:MAG TPA: SLC13 family permease [Phycisphaerales bacterium]
MLDPTVETPDSPRWIRWGGLIGGVLASIAVYLVLTHGGLSFGAAMSHAGRATIALGVLMALWWITEAIPVEATSLVPMAMFPLVGVAGMREACAPYADPIVFFFMGGMLIGAAMEKWGLPRRFAFAVLAVVGGRPVMLVGGIVFATGAISMWVNNTSTAVMMLPIAMGLYQFVAAHAGDDEKAGVSAFGICLVLAVAYASNIGGVGTLFGSSPNVVLTGQLRQTFGQTLSFVEYAKIGVPLVLVLLPLTWLVLIVMHPPKLRPIAGVRELVVTERWAMGAWSSGEIVVVCVFVTAMLGWIFLEPINGVLTGMGLAKNALTESGVAVIAALSLFLIPVSLSRHEFALDWKTGSKIPWGILLLFGGGMSLAEAMRANGVNQAIGELFRRMGDVHPLIILGVVTVAIIALTEVASNTAVATTFIPIAIAVAPSMGLHPFALAMATALAASNGYALPIGTPPNALAYATGRVSMRTFVKTGIVIDIVAALAITAVLYWGEGWLYRWPEIVK